MRPTRTSRSAGRLIHYRYLGVFVTVHALACVLLLYVTAPNVLASETTAPSEECCPTPATNSHTLAAQQAASGELGFFSWLFDTTGFPRRWNCGIWSAELGWLHICSDIAIWAAYMAIPLLLGFFLYKRKIPLPGITWFFIAFIGTCGFTHLIEAIIFWHPIYRLAGVWKLITAIASWLTVFALIPLIPRVLRWPSLDQANQQLEHEANVSREAEAEIRQIIDAAPVGMLLVDEQGRIQLANHEVESTFGYSQKELIGQPVEMLIPFEHRNAHPQQRQAYFNAPVARRMGGERELFGRQKDGQKVPLDIGLKPITTSAGPFVLASIIDISAQKLAELRLKELNQALEHKNTELEQFVYTASHDLKSPLVSILGFAGLIQSDLKKGRTDRFEEHLNWIITSSNKLRQTIDDLLELSRVGRVSEESEPVNVNDLVHEVLDALKQQVETSNVQITVAEDLPAMNINRTRLFEVFENLISNALKYGRPEQGEFRIEIDGAFDGDRLMYSVADNGRGIPAEYHDKIFGLFEKLHKHEDGTGVGLAIVKRVVTVHGGKIAVESQPNQGAKFVISFPAMMRVIQ